MMLKITISLIFLAFPIFCQNRPDEMLNHMHDDDMHDLMTGLFDFKPTNGHAQANDFYSDPKMMYGTLYKTILYNDAAAETISDETKIRHFKPYNQLFKQLSLYKKPNADDWARMAKEGSRKSSNNHWKRLNKNHQGNFVWSIFKRFTQFQLNN